MNFLPDYDKNAEDILALTAMIGYVQKNYPNKILLKDISSAGNCCKTKCTSLFQKYLSSSPLLYLNRYRLEKSIFLLRNTAMSVTEVAYTCGFSNTSYFCELFHKYYHITPRQCRRGSWKSLLCSITTFPATNLAHATWYNTGNALLQVTGLHQVLKIQNCAWLSFYFSDKIQTL